MEQLKRELTDPSPEARAKGAVPRPMTNLERRNAVSDRKAESPNSYEVFTEQKADAYLRYLERGLKAGLPLTVLAAGAAQAGVDNDTIEMGNRMVTEEMSVNTQAEAGALNDPNERQSSVSRFFNTLQDTIGGTRGMVDTGLMAVGAVLNPFQKIALATEGALLARDAVNYLRENPGALSSGNSSGGQMRRAR